MGYFVLVVPFLTAVFIMLLIKNAKTLNLIDIPNERSVHLISTPKGAGIALVSTLFLGLAFGATVIYQQYAFTFAGILLVFVLGIYDDLKNSSLNLKFLVICIAAVLVCLNDLLITTAGSYFGTDFAFGWITIPVTIFSIVGFTNALNLIDGIDGLSGSISLLILSGLGYIGLIHNDVLILSVIKLLIPALLVFLIFNWNPAKIFLGDSGSLTLGFVIAVLSIKALDYIDPISILFITAIPIIDTVVVMIRRKQQGYSIFTPDRCHLHHLILYALGGHIKKAVSLIICFQFIFTLFGVFVAGGIGQELALLIFLVSLLGFYFAILRLAKDQQC